MPRLSVSPRRRVAASASSADEDLPGQMLLFAPIAGRVVDVTMELHIPACTEQRLLGRIEGAAKRLRRGAVASGPKVRRATVLLEELAGLFDGR